MPSLWSRRVGMAGRGSSGLAEHTSSYWLLGRAETCLHSLSEMGGAPRCWCAPTVLKLDDSGRSFYTVALTWDVKDRWFVSVGPSKKILAQSEFAGVSSEYELFGCWLELILANSWLALAISAIRCFSISALLSLLPCCCSLRSLSRERFSMLAISETRAFLNVIESMEGVIGVKPLVQKSERLQSVSRRWKRKFRHDNPDFSQAELSLYGLWAYDAMWAVAKAAEIVQFREPSFLQNSSISISKSPFITRVSKTGPKIRKTLSEITFEGLSGKFHLVNGKLEPSSFQILNVVGKSEREVGIWIPSQGILLESNGNISGSPKKKLRTVIFPGDSTDVPKGWELPVSGNKLKIAVPMEAGFPEFFKVERDTETNTSKVSGCFIDMFAAVMAAMPYAVLYEILPFEHLNGSGSSSRAQSYDELSCQVSSQFDGAVGDITITHKRSKYVDFTLPFTQGGIFMIVQKSADGNLSDKWFFVKPFTEELWFSAIALFVLTGLALWILEHRFNGAYRGPPTQHAGMIFYFPFMSLVYAQREKIVNNLARLVVVVWMFVIFILTSTYTASLSARLTVQGLQPVVTDASELIRKGHYVGCRSGSFIYDFLQEMGFDKSKIITYQYPNDIDVALYTGSKKGGISAFFSVKLYTELFLSKYCPKYTTVGPIYPTEGYAFVLGKGSPLVADVSRAIIELTESGRLAEIEGQLRLNQNCIGRDNTDGYSVPLRNLQALFAITGGVTATCVIAFLITYLYRNRDIIKRISSSNTTIWSKVRAICKHFDERDPTSYHYTKEKLQNPC